MTLQPALAALMIDTVTVAPAATTDAYGRTNHDAPLTYTGVRVRPSKHRVTDRDGKDHVATGLVYLPGHPEIGLDDLLTLPDGSVPVLLSMDRVSDEQGPHHTVLHYGSG